MAEAVDRKGRSTARDLATHGGGVVTDLVPCAAARTAKQKALSHPPLRLPPPPNLPQLPAERTGTVVMLSLKSPISARRVPADASGGRWAHCGFVDRLSGAFRTFLGDLYEPNA